MPISNFIGQFGSPLFDVSAVVGFLMATVISILDSVGDYYATANVCRVPTPPSHAVNRGIAIEGFFSTVSGLFGVGHATTTYGGNIGAIGMTRVSKTIPKCLYYACVVFDLFHRYPFYNNTIIIVYVKIPTWSVTVFRPSIQSNRD